MGLASVTEFAKTTPRQLAAAQRNVERVVQEQDAFRQRCLDDPSHAADVPDSVRGELLTGETFRAEDLLDQRPFQLAEELPAGGIAMAAGSRSWQGR